MSERTPASELKPGDVLYDTDTVTSVRRHPQHAWRVVAETTGGEYSFPETTTVPVRRGSDEEPAGDLRPFPGVGRDGTVPCTECPAHAALRYVEPALSYRDVVVEDGAVVFVYTGEVDEGDDSTDAWLECPHCLARFDLPETFDWA